MLLNENPLLTEATSVQEEREREEEERKLVDRLRRIVNSCYEASSKQFSRRRRFKDRYFAFDEEMERRKAGWQSRFVHNLGHFSIEVAACFFTQSLIGRGSRPFFVAQPWTVDEQPKAEILTKKLQYDFLKSKIRRNIYTLTKDTCLYGNGVIKTFWDRQEDLIPQRPALKHTFDGYGISAFLEPRPPRRVLKKDQPEAVTVNLNDFWPDPLAKDIESCRFICHRFFVSMDYLREREAKGVYKNVDKLKETHTPQRSFEDNSRLFRESLGKEIELDFSTSATSNKMVEIVEIWAPGSKVFTLGNMSVLLDAFPGMPRYEHRSYPFVMLSNQPMTNELWGISFFEATEKLLAEIDSLQNLAHDNYHFALKGSMFVETGALGSKGMESFANREPGTPVMVTDLNAVKYIPAPPVDQSAINGMGQLIQQAQQSLGINDFLRGIAPPSNIRSEGSLQALAQAGANRLLTSVSLFAEQLVEMGNQWVALNHQFMDRAVNFSLGGKAGMNFVEIDPEEIPLGIDVKVNLGSIAQGDKEMRVQQMLQAFNLFSQVPGFNAIQMAKEILLTGEDIDDPSRLFLLSEKDAAKLQVQQHLMALGKGAPPGGNAPAQTGEIQVPQAGNLPNPRQVTQGNTNAQLPSVPQV